MGWGNSRESIRTDDHVGTLATDGAAHVAQPMALTTKGNGEAFLSEDHGSLSTGGGQAGQGYPAVLEPIAPETAATLTSGVGQNGRHAGRRQEDDVNLAAQAWGVRRLTPVECERLQAFPDRWTEPAGSDSGRYRALGNAVTVSVPQWLFARMLDADRSG